MSEITITVEDWKLLKKFFVSLTSGKPESGELLWRFIDSVELRTIHRTHEPSKMERYWTTERKQDE